MHRALAAPFPDPGFAKFGSTYFLYRTAAHFDVSNSASPDGGYTVPEPSMPALPGWVGPAPSGSRHLWAPDVFSVDEGERDLYVMYFTGYYPGTAARPCGANCIGVATSAAPSHGFVARAHPICAKAPKYEAIDPTMYLTPGGDRYLVFKRHETPDGAYAIRAIQMDSARGLYPLPGGVRRTLVFSPNKMMEAPSLIEHGHRVWLFLARRDWHDCSYATDAWSAGSLIRGRFTRADWVLTSASTRLCRPGGASVLRDGASTRIAFHSWKSFHPPVRQTWIGTIRWDARGDPHLAAESAAPAAR